MGRLIDPLDARFMAAVGWSDQMLAAVDDGWEPPCTSADLDMVRNAAFQQALHDIAHSFPDPVEYAAMLEPAFAAALVDAVQGRNGGFWVADNELVPLLRSLGLIGIRDRELNCFAMQVRRALKAEERGKW